MMPTKEDIKGNILLLSEKIRKLMENLMQEKGYIDEEMGVVASLFMEDQTGRNLHARLMEAQRQIQNSYNELEQLRGDMIRYSGSELTR
jgi:hypothetical protein